MTAPKRARKPPPTDVLPVQRLGLRRPPAQDRGIVTFDRVLATASRLLAEVGAEGLTTNPYGQKIHSSQFPDQNRPVDGHRSQPRDQPLNPAWAVAAPGLHDPSALPHPTLPALVTHSTAPHITGP